MTRPSQSLANTRENGNVIYIADDRKRRARRHRSEDFDQLIIAAWKQHCADIISFDEAGQRHHRLVELSDGRPVT